MIEGNIYRNHGFFPWALGPLGGSCRKKPCNQSKGNYLLVKTSFSDTHVVEYPTISELKSSYRSIYPVYSTIVSHSHFIPIVPYCGWISSDIHYNYSNYPELYPNDVGKITLYHIYKYPYSSHIQYIYTHPTLTVGFWTIAFFSAHFCLKRSCMWTGRWTCWEVAYNTRPRWSAEVRILQRTNWCGTEIGKRIRLCGFPINLLGTHTHTQYFPLISTYHVLTIYIYILR